jgi:hypothetical protein
MTDAGGGEIHCRGRTKPARAHDEDARLFQSALTVYPDTWENEVPAVANQLFGGEWRRCALRFTHAEIYITGGGSRSLHLEAVRIPVGVRLGVAA